MYGFIQGPRSVIHNPLRPPESQIWSSDGIRRKTPSLPSGDQSGVEPPGPIPNPEVKRPSADDSGTTGPVKVGRRQVNARHFAMQSAGLFFYREVALPLRALPLNRRVTLKSAVGRGMKGAS